MTDRLAAVDSHQKQTGFTSRTELARRSFGAPWWLAVLAVPLLLAAVMATVRAGPIEDDLTTRTAAALADAELSGVKVEFTGRDATLHVPATVNGDAALSVVSGVPGVRSATISDQRASATPTRPGHVAPFTIERAGKTLTVTATVPTIDAKDALLEAGRKSGAQVVDDVTVRPSTAPVPPSALTPLTKLKSDARAEFDGDTLTLSGAVPSEDIKEAAGDAARSALPDSDIDNQLVISVGDETTGP